MMMHDDNSGGRRNAPQRAWQGGTQLQRVAGSKVEASMLCAVPPTPLCGEHALMVSALRCIVRVAGFDVNALICRVTCVW
jgi:hypothetical protein